MQRVLLLSLLGVVSVSGCGCYWSTSVHACDCTIAETDCVGGGGSGGIWTTGCSSCACTAVTTAPSVAAPSSPPVVDDHGCYDVTDTHQCDCNTCNRHAHLAVWASGRVAVDATTPARPIQSTSTTTAATMWVTRISATATPTSRPLARPQVAHG